MDRVLPISEVKARLPELVSDVEDKDETIIVTRNGRPAAVLVNHAEYESLKETLDVLSDPDLMNQIRESRAFYRALVGLEHPIREELGRGKTPGAPLDPHHAPERQALDAIGADLGQRGLLPAALFFKPCASQQSVFRCSPSSRSLPPEHRGKTHLITSFPSAIQIKPSRLSSRRRGKPA